MAPSCEGISLLCPFEYPSNFSVCRLRLPLGVQRAGADGYQVIPSAATRTRKLEFGLSKNGKAPAVTVFGFIAQPEIHVFLKPNVMRIAAQSYGFDFEYQSCPSWKTYASHLKFADTLRRNLRDLRPRDMIDIQSFLWVLGSDEY